MLFATILTGYILLAVVFEERDLAREFGDSYERYRARTPMLVPRFHPPAARKAAVVDREQQPASALGI